MNKAMEIICALIACMLVAYFVIAIAAWQFNPSGWSSTTSFVYRAITAVFFLLIWDEIE